MKESEHATEEVAESSQEARSALTGTLSNLKFALPGDLLLPDNLFGSPAAQVRALECLTSTLRRS